ncbi:MAG: cupredoxin domain-containing protein [Alphaproteobacteria bacterium]|nr:cupredoxin domain-containing protein [Alphaproteobacteria bacterium]
MRPLVSRLLLVTGLLGALAACGSSPSTPAASPAADGRRIDVQISGDGYTPDTIQAGPGEALTLVFERMDENNCGGEVVFPATGERHTVPVGTKVEVAVTTPPSGKLAFTCGMGMYEGAVVVHGS